VLHPGRVEGRPPAPLVILSELEIVALAVHSDSNAADAGPGAQPRPQRLQRAVVRGHSAAGEPDRRHEEPAAWVHY
jgi:hypothetical protein